MPSVSLNASSSVTVPAGSFVQVTGTGLATFGPGRMSGQSVGINGQARLGPYPTDMTVYLNATGTALSYTVAARSGIAPDVTYSSGSPSGSLDPATGLPVGGSSNSSNKTAQRRSRAAQWNGPAWIRARTLAEEIAAGTTTVQVGRRFRHSSNNQLYECVVAGSIGTAEPATWIPNLYLTASPYMTPAGGGTAQFLALGIGSRAPRSDRPAPVVTNVGVNNIGNNALFLPDANTFKYGMTAGIPTGIQTALPVTSRTAAQQKVWMPGTNRFDFAGGGAALRLINIYDPVASGSNYTGKGLSFNFTAFSQAVGLAFNSNDGGPEIFINGSPLTEDPFGLLDSAGVFGHIVVVFPEGYPVNDFRIVQTDNLVDIYTHSRGYIMPVVEPEYRLLMLADSIGNTTTNAGKARYADSVMQRIANSLGANTVACMQFGGTGYVQRNGGNNNATDYLTANPAPFPNGTADAIVFMHGNNDATGLAGGSVTKAQLKAVWDLAASQHPNAIIQICGLWGAPSTASDIAVVAEQVIYQAWQEWGNPNSDFIGGMLNDSGVFDPHVRPAKSPFVSYNASQNFGLNASSGMDYRGNSHAFIGNVSGNDNIHPTMAGNIERARRISLSADANLARRGY